jgi:hypothetical protein
LWPRNKNTHASNKVVPEMPNLASAQNAHIDDIVDKLFTSMTGDENGDIL